MASSSSATSKSPRKTYDVFLSFRGEDVRKTFLDHLNNHLKLKGIESFKDNEKLRRGESIGPVLLQAIEESRFAIVIFSKDYASSTWCLDEVAKIMDCKEKLDLVVVPIFYDVEPSNVRQQTGSFAESFAKHKERFKDNDEGKVNVWRKALTDVANIKGHDLNAEYYGYELNCIKGVVDDIFKHLRPAPSIPKDLVGLESPLEEICTLLEVVSFENVKLLGIWGMGGLGKTTLARVAFAKLCRGFKHSCFLDDIREKNSKLGMESLQATLLKDILKVDKMEIPNVYQGTDEIKKRLKQLRVLIVLDDVDSPKQLENLVGDGEWLSDGSRIIITTRDKHLFTSFKVAIPHYEIQKLDKEKALKLFSWHAFKKESPDKGFEDLSMSFVTYADGLPLALKLWGNALCGRKEEKQWKSALEKIKGIPNDKFKVCSQLEISVDGLDDQAKKIFLDIACFFRHKRRDYIEDALESCGRHPGIEIPMLIERCLIFESSEYGDKYISMHDLIQEMGWHIASQENPRSRIWQLKDVDDVLSRKMKSEHIEGILLPSTEEWYNDENIRRAFEAFKHMENLKMLIVDGNVKIFLDMDNYLPSRELRWLDFKNYGFPSLWITKNFHKLTYLGLSRSILVESPNFDKMPNLERLNFSHCSELKEIHSSIGNLERLVSLNLRGCSVLEELPSFNQVLSLKFLDLQYCQNLKSFPEIRTSILGLVELNLEKVGIKELPLSIQQLYSLTKLCLTRCQNLVYLSNGLCELGKLIVLKITCCSKIELLPTNLDGLVSLEYLNLQRSGFVSLPNSVSKLRNLQYLDITNCQNLENLPKLPESMKEIYVDCHFGFRRNIFQRAIKCSEYSISFYCEDEFEAGTSLAMKFIPFPLDRMNPFSFSYPIPKANILRSFKYRCYGAHNGISINLGSSWYSKIFWGFAICFRPLTGNMWEPHSYQDIDGRMEQCKIKTKLSHKDNKEKDIERECVIVGSKALGYYIDGHMCIVNIPFTSLMRDGSYKTTMDGVTLNDFSRFEVAFRNLEASAYYWGCSLLHHNKRKKNNVKKYISTSKISHEDSKNDVTREICINGLQVPQNVCTLVPRIGSITCIESIICITTIRIEDYTNFMWTNLASWDVNLQGGTTKIGHLSECISRLHHYHYLHCYSNFKRCEKKHQLPANIRELYACHTLASESNIAELASKYSELYSVSFSDGVVTLSTAELTKKFSELLLNRNTPFTFTYTTTDKRQPNNSNMRLFKYSSRASNKISIDLDPTWYNQNFLGFVVCFLFSGKEIWESNPNIRPFRHCEIIAKLTHKDDGNKVLLKKCMIGRLYNEEFDFTFGDRRLVCFAYIPFSSLWNESKSIMDNVTPNHYSIFEVTFLDLEVSTNWSCDLLYTTEAIRRKWEQEHVDSGNSDLGLDKTTLWQLTKIVYLAQSKMVSMPECSNTKVVQLLYTNSGVGILALSSNGILKFWKSSHDDQNPSRKHWHPNSGSSMTDNEEAIPCMGLSKDDSYVVSTSGKHVSLFSIMEFKVMKTFTWLKSATTFLAFHPHNNNTIAIGTEDSTIYIWDVRIDEPRLWLLEGHLKCITGLAFSTKCNILVSSGADAQLCAWSIDTWQPTISVPIRLRGDKVEAGDKQPTQVMFHADQVHLLVTHETQLAIYDASNKMKRIRQWIPNGSLSAPISSATYCCNSRLVYASFRDGNIGVLEAKTLRLRCHIAPSAYLSQVISNRSEAAFPVVIAAHPQESIQFAVGLTDGSVKVIKLLKSQVEREVPLPEDDEILNVEDNGHGFGAVIFDDVSIDEANRRSHIERLPKYSEASMEEKSVIHAALSEDQPAFTQPNPIIGEEIQSENNYHNDNEEDYETTTSQQELAAEKKTNKRHAAMKIDELEARLKEKDPTATATSNGAKKIRLQKGILIRSPKSSTIVPHLLSADFMVSKALEKAAAAAAAAVTSEKMAAPHHPYESQINIVDSDEAAVGLENMVAAGVVSTEPGPSQQLPEPVPSTDDLVLAISPGNSNLQTERPSKKRGLDNNDPFKLAAEDYADEFFIIKSLRSALATTEKLLDKKRHLKNELSKERSRGIELEARNKELEVQLQNQQPTIDHLEKENHELTQLVQTYEARATQAETANSDLLLAQKNLVERYGTLEKQQLEDKEQYKKLEKEQLEVKDECEGLKRSWNDAMLKNEILNKKLLQAEESGVRNWQQSPNFLNEVISRAMGLPEQRRKFFQVLEANPTGKEKLLDDNTNACLHGMRKMQQAIYTQLREIAPDDFDVQKWGLPKELPDIESQNGEGS